MNKYLKRLSNALSFIGFAHLAILIAMLVHLLIVLVMFGLIYPEEKYSDTLNKYYQTGGNDDSSWNVEVFSNKTSEDISHKQIWEVLYSIKSPGTTINDGDYSINGGLVRKEDKNYILAHIIVYKYGKKPLDELYKEYPFQYQLLVLIAVYLLNYVLVGNIRLLPWKKIN